MVQSLLEIKFISIDVFENWVNKYILSFTIKCKCTLDTPRYNAKRVTDYNSVKGENTAYIYDIKFPRENP